MHFALHNEQNFQWTVHLKYKRSVLCTAVSCFAVQGHMCGCVAWRACITCAYVCTNSVHLINTVQRLTITVDITLLSAHVPDLTVYTVPARITQIFTFIEHCTWILHRGVQSQRTLHAQSAPWLALTLYSSYARCAAAFMNRVHCMCTVHRCLCWQCILREHVAPVRAMTVYTTCTPHVGDARWVHRQRQQVHRIV